MARLAAMAATETGRGAFSTASTAWDDQPGRSALGSIQRRVSVLRFWCSWCRIAGAGPFPRLNPLLGRGAQAPAGSV